MLTKQWQKQLKLAEIYFEKNRFTQSLITLREAIITYILEENGNDWTIREKRENIKDLDNLPSDIKNLLENVRKLRNKSSHGFIGRQTGDKELRDFINKLKKYLDEAKKILINPHHQ